MSQALFEVGREQDLQFDMVDFHTLTPDLGSILDQGVVHQEKLREELQVLYIRYSWPVNLFKADLDRAADRRSQ